MHFAHNENNSARVRACGCSGVIFQWMRALCWSRVGGENMPGGCRFNARWLEDEKYKLWLKRGPNPRLATCKICKKDVQLFTMGEAALSSHMKGKF